MALAGQRLIAGDIDIVQNPPRCQAIQTVVQSIPNNVQTSITLDAEDYDTDGIHSIVSNTNRLTIVTAGLYEVNGQVVMAANATGTRDVRVIKNSALINGLRKTEVGNATVSGHVIVGPVGVQLSVGDILEIAITQTSGGALNTVAINGLVSYLRVRRISA